MMIEVSRISRDFGTFHAVNDVSFSIPTGQIVGLLGPNGAGKTTTMRMITGFLQPTSGSILIDGEDISKNPVESKRKIGYMPESAPLYGEMIVKDYLDYVARMQGQNPDEKVPLLCRECGLKEVMHKNISELSRGYRQRVGLAHALMNDPEILILDEPTSGLDPNQITEVRSLIKEIGKTRTVIISTHILGEVEMLCSRVIIISGGKLVADSPTEKLRENYGNNIKIKAVVSASEKEILQVLNSIDGISNIEVSPVKDDSNGKSLLQALISVHEGKEIRSLVAKSLIENGFELYELCVIKNSLEDVFHALTKDSNSNEKAES